MNGITARSLLIALWVFSCATTAHAGQGAELDLLIGKYASHYGVPETLVRRIIKRESNYNPGAYHAGYYGLMQIKPQTARTMGYRGASRGLLDAETNLMFGVKYLAGAYLVAGGSESRALRLYSRGYYYEAKRKRHSPVNLGSEPWGRLGRSCNCVGFVRMRVHGQTTEFSR